MKIIVLNGSPKGNVSVTMQYVHFIQKKFSQHELIILNISQRLNVTKNRENVFQDIIDEIRSADAVLWAFPVYFLLVPSNYKRFIELIWERGVEDAFKGKYTCSLSTSIHFFDHIAHNYINGICDDLEMKYAGSFSADMYDLLKEKERIRLIQFAEKFFDTIEGNKSTTKAYSPLVHSTFDYLPGDTKSSIETGNKKILVLTDSTGLKGNAGKMLQSFTSAYSSEIEVIDIDGVDIKGSCLGCIQCGYDTVACTMIKMVMLTSLIQK